MTKPYSHEPIAENLNEFETMNFRKIEEDVRGFFKYSNEKFVLTDKIERIIDPKKSFSLLDVGCGEGYVIRNIYRKVKRCVALDPDHKMLEILRKYVGNNSRVVLVNSKLEDFETTEKFDVTLSSHTLSYFNDKQLAINKMLDYTKKDGKLILVLHCYDSEQMLMLREMFRLIKGREIKHIYAEVLYNYLIKQGFDAKLEKVETVTIFPSMEIPLRLSYFLFRTDYDKTSRRNQLVIHKYLERKRFNYSVEIRTLHGIINIRKNVYPSKLISREQIEHV